MNGFQSSVFLSYDKIIKSWKPINVSILLYLHLNCRIPWDAFQQKLIFHYCLADSGCASVPTGICLLSCVRAKAILFSSVSNTPLIDKISLLVDNVITHMYLRAYLIFNVHMYEYSTLEYPRNMRTLCGKVYVSYDF